MNTSLKRQLLKTFAQMIADFKNPEEVEFFLKDFFDEQELEKYIRRLSTIYWLKKGRDSENIRRNLGVKQKEITEAATLIQTKGVKLAIKKLEAEEWANVWADKIKRFSRQKQ